MAARRRGQHDWSLHGDLQRDVVRWERLWSETHRTMPASLAARRGRGPDVGWRRAACAKRSLDHDDVGPVRELVADRRQIADLLESAGFMQPQRRLVCWMRSPSRSSASKLGAENRNANLWEKFIRDVGTCERRGKVTVLDDTGVTDRLARPSVHMGNACKTALGSRRKDSRS